MAKTAGSGDVEPIERLETKVKALVALVERLKTSHQQALDDNARLTVEVEGLQSRVADVEHANAELVALREERDRVRARVETILGQLEAIQD